MDVIGRIEKDFEMQVVRKLVNVETLRDGRKLKTHITHLSDGKGVTCSVYSKFKKVSINFNFVNSKGLQKSTSFSDFDYEFYAKTFYNHIKSKRR